MEYWRVPCIYIKKRFTKGVEGIEIIINMVLEDSESDDDNFFIVLFSFPDDKSMTSSIEYYYKTLFTVINKAVEYI